MSVRAYIGVGSNLDPLANVTSALAELDEIPATRCVLRSSLYRSAPMGPTDQPDYINAVAGLDTDLSAPELLRALQEIEARHGRERGPVRWGPRTLDLDLLLYGDRRIDTPELMVPHPGLHERPFVLYPLAEIAAEARVPGRGSLAELLAACPPAGLSRL